MKNGKKYGKDKRKFSNIHNTYTYITIPPLIQTYVHYYIQIDTVQKLRFGNIFNAFIFFWWSENCMLGVWINQEFKSSLALYTWILGMKSLNFWNVDNSSFRRISMWANHWHKKNLFIKFIFIQHKNFKLLRYKYL